MGGRYLIQVIERISIGDSPSLSEQKREPSRYHHLNNFIDLKVSFFEFGIANSELASSSDEVQLAVLQMIKRIIFHL